MEKDGNNVNYVKMEIMLMQMKGKTPHRWLKYTTRESVFVCLCGRISFDCMFDCIEIKSTLN